MSVNDVRHMTYICHIQTLNHTYKHNLDPHAGFSMIPALRRSFTPGTLDRWGGPQIYSYSFLRTRMDQWTFLSIYVWLAHMYMENQGSAHFTTLFTPVDPYREFPHTDRRFY